MTIIEQLAHWAVELEIDAIPERVRKLGRYQAMSVVAACHAGAACGPGKTLIKAVQGWNHAGPARAIPGGVRLTTEDAILLNAGLSISLDYDDYLLFGHTGHSAVCVPLALGEELGKSGAEVLCAQIIANELSGRMGGAVVLGPQNGQLWTHIHLIGAAAAGAKLMGLDATRTAHALAIAMAQPNFALYPSLMAPPSKLLAAATPALNGLQAARLAAAGMEGPLEAIEHGKGVLRFFSFRGLPEMFTGLGRSWVTDTLAFKGYPGCAYIDTTMDALEMIKEQYREKHGAEIEAADVAAVEIEASALTYEMEHLSREYLDTAHLNPININFSIPWNVALSFLRGRLDAAALDDDYLRDANREIGALARKVTLKHDWNLTLDFVMALDAVVSLRDLLSGFSRRDFARIAKGARSVKTGGGALDFSLRTLKELRDQLDERQKGFIKGLAWWKIKDLISHLGKRGPSGFDLGKYRLEDFVMPFAARVKLKTAKGETYEAEQRIPWGANGQERKFETVEDKLRREAARALDDSQVAKALEVLKSFEDHSAGEIAAACTGN